MEDQHKFLLSNNFQCPDRSLLEYRQTTAILLCNMFFACACAKKLTTN